MKNVETMRDDHGFIESLYFYSFSKTVERTKATKCGIKDL